MRTRKTKEKKPERTVQAIFSAQEYEKRLQKQILALIPADKLEAVQTQDHPRGVLSDQVFAIAQAMARGEVIPPILVTYRSDKTLALLDGQQRLAAAKQVKYPIMALVLGLGSPRIEKEHFIRWHNCKRVDASIVSVLDANNESLKELQRINELPTHAMHHKIWFGKSSVAGEASGEQPADMIPAATLLRLAKKGLAQEDMEDCLQFIATIAPIQQEHVSNKYPCLLGIFFAFEQIKNTYYDPADADHAAHIRSFPWEKARITARTQTIPEKVCAKILEHWNGHREK